MPAATIIPECDGAFTPSKPAGEPLIARMVEQEIEQGFAFALGHAREPERESRIDVKPFAAGLWMGADDGVFIFWRFNRDIRLHRLPGLR